MDSFKLKSSLVQLKKVLINTHTHTIPASKQVNNHGITCSWKFLYEKVFGDTGTSSFLPVFYHEFSTVYYLRTFEKEGTIFLRGSSLGTFLSTNNNIRMAEEFQKIFFDDLF